MTYSLETLRDFIGALSVVALLAASYGGISRQLVGHRHAPMMLGGLFGLCAALQMMMPLSPVEGIIVDMRNVPIVLAGAFLGPRALLLCLSIAITTRISLGGIGVPAGVGGMLIAGIVGFIWAEAVRPLPRLTGRHMITLAAFANLHLLSGLLIPWDIAVWFYTKAAPLIVVLNLVSISLVAMLLDRERRRIDEEATLRASVWADPGSGLLLTEPFVKELRDIDAANPHGAVRGLAVIELRHASWLQSCWGDEALGQVHGALRKRLEHIVLHGRSIGLSTSGQILVPITAREIASRTLMMTLHRAASEYSVTLDGKGSVKISVDINILPMDSAPTSTADMMDQIRPFATSIKKLKPKIIPTPNPTTEALLVNGGASSILPSLADRQGQLFAKAEMIMTKSAK